MAGVFRVTAEPPRGSLALVPAYNALNSLSLLHAVEAFPAVDEWVRRTAAALSVPRIKLNRVLFDELGEVLVVDDPDQDFPSYLASLAAQRADELRSRALAGNAPNGDAARLSDEAAALLDNPVRLHDTIVSHLHELWERYLEPEWASVERKLNLNLSYLLRSTPGSGVPPEAIMANLQRFIAGARGYRPETQNIVFVPSPHTGRYTTSMQAGSSLYLFFDAALHMELLMRNTRVSQAELVGRLSALAEPARLRVLAALAQHDDVT